MRAGFLRHLITIQTPAETQNAYGETTRTWSTYATRWAAVETLSGNEAVSARQVLAKASHNVRMRYLAGVTPKMRVSWGTRTFGIGAVMNVDERDRETILLCTEILA